MNSIVTFELKGNKSNGLTRPSQNLNSLIMFICLPMNLISNSQRKPIAYTPLFIRGDGLQRIKSVPNQFNSRVRNKSDFIYISTNVT